eukprot:2099878-Amphidinium_carterae.2
MSPIDYAARIHPSCALNEELVTLTVAYGSGPSQTCTGIRLWQTRHMKRIRNIASLSEKEALVEATGQWLRVCPDHDLFAWI